jgi:hypothetical protein
MWLGIELIAMQQLISSEIRSIEKSNQFNQIGFLSGRNVLALGFL